MSVDSSGLDDVIAAIVASNADIVIVRSPAIDVGVPATLSIVPGYDAFHADTLMYWSWSGDEGGPDVDDSPLIAHDVGDEAELERLVRAVFDGYTNHYSANPLLDASLALDGYCEWAVGLLRSGDASCMVLDGPDIGPTGFAVVDWGAEPADVRLAGMLPEARGQGWYRWFVAHLMHEADARRRTPLWISTQSHNTAVMRQWARLGWLPSHSIHTTHLVRASLMPAACS